MKQENAGLFAEFDDSASARDTQGLSGEFRVRPAEISDTDAVGRISAEREGGIAREHAEGFRRELEYGRTQGKAMVFVAELDGQVIGFGRVQYREGEATMPEGGLPGGWYLTGTVVDSRFRRRGIGTRLTAARMRWIAERGSAVYYFANARNRVSIALHEGFGFIEIARGPAFGSESFVGGEGVLFKAELGGSEWRAP